MIIAAGLGLVARIAWLRARGKEVPRYLLIARTIAAAAGAVSLFIVLRQQGLV